MQIAAACLISSENLSIVIKQQNKKKTL